MTLSDFFDENHRVALGFSGGVDSSYLLYAAKKYNADIRAYYIKTAFQPEFELTDAKRVAKYIGVDLSVINIDILSTEDVVKNSNDRCYYCKRKMFTAIAERAFEDGYLTLIDGTNASDNIYNRPGMKALTEMSVRSPLRECGLTKADIRRLSKEAKLFTWNKPAYACLATRIPTGERITSDILWKVECAENALFNMGFFDFRVRTYYGAARLQFTNEQENRAYKLKNKICKELEPFFDIILLDLKGR